MRLNRDMPFVVRFPSRNTEDFAISYRFKAEGDAELKVKHELAYRVLSLKQDGALIIVFGFN